MSRQENSILDARILGQLLLMQSILPSLPDETSIFQFVCRGLMDIPGVAAASYAGSPTTTLSPPVMRIPLTVSGSTRGELLFQISDPLAFAPYEDYLKNFSFMLAVILEERSQRRLNELHQSELEHHIQERTQQLRGEIAEREQAEVALQKSEASFRSIFEKTSTGYVLTSPDGSLLKVNAAMADLLGYTIDELQLVNFRDITDPDDIPISIESVRCLLAGEQDTYQFEKRYLHRNGATVWTFVNTSLLRDSQNSPLYFITSITDITKRKRAEEGLRESEARYRTLFEYAPDGILIADSESYYLDANESMCRMLGYTRDELIKLHASDIVTQVEIQQIGPALSMIEARSNYQREWQFRRKDGSVFTAEVIATMMPDGNLLAMIRDTTERKRAEEKIQQQLEHLTALGAIDRVITSNFDLELSLSEILTHVTLELDIDAADILILNSSSQMLEFAAGYGFHTKAIEGTRLRLGESYAGRAALERHLVHKANLKDAPDLIVTKNLLEEGFVSHYSVPLIAKGQVTGVLEIFHRTALDPDAEWFDFLKTLAGQAAIAIENATLFENLQRSNSELTLAYDATIEGWSRALDLRDKETEGHTQRVTKMTMELARAFGLNEAELGQVRWGALLHDIGKMGIPDGILLKPGPLTEEEWVKMRLHPTIAYDLLSPIRYLRLALDIPHYHHEKWDGTGYPYGLKGVQIPLVARIFAVVDVWDALNSDRPYRPAWTREDVREHIRALSGTHFDPQVISVFMQMFID